MQINSGPTADRASPFSSAAVRDDGGIGVDHATLDAALAFIDEYELSHSDDILALAPIVTTHSVDPVQQGGQTVVTSARMRRRNELVYLRGVVNELEGELATLKKRGDEIDRNEQPLALVWEELAARQYEQRQRAEVENVKLRTMLEEQIRVAKNRERVLTKRTMAERLLPSSSKRLRKSDTLDDQSVFDDLLQTIDEMHHQVEEVFADERFACTQPTLQDHHARNDDGDDGPVIEVFDSRISPFDMHRVADAMWYHMSMQSSDKSVLTCELVELNDELFKLEYRSSLELPRLMGSFHGKIAGRRYIEGDRILLLWAALVDPGKISGTSMDGVFMRQKGWTVIQRPPPIYQKPGRPVSLAQMYHIIIPTSHGHKDEDEQRRKVGTLTQFVLSTVDFHVDVGRTTIENLLLDDGWKTASSPGTIHNIPVATDALAVRSL